MNKEEVLNKYTEYGIPLNVAKSLEGYSFTHGDLEYLISDLENSVTEYESLDLGVFAQLEFCNIDLTLTYRQSYKGKKYLEYGCHFKNTEGWNSFESCEINFDISHIESVEKLEYTMYYILIKLAKEYNIYWSKFND